MRVQSESEIDLEATLTGMFRPTQSLQSFGRERSASKQRRRSVRLLCISSRRHSMVPVRGARLRAATIYVAQLGGGEDLEGKCPILICGLTLS